MQNHRHTAEDLRNALDRLPRSVREAIRSDNVDEVIRKVVDKYHLRIDQGAILEDELTYVMYGLERPESFVKNLMKEGPMDQTLATNIAKDVERDVFQAIRNDLMRIHEPGYVPEEDVDEDIPYEQALLNIYKDLEKKGDTDEMNKIRKNLFRQSAPTDKIEDLIKFSFMPVAEIDRIETAAAITVPRAASNTVDLRAKRKLPPLETRGGPREREPEVINSSTATPQSEQKSFKLRPSDGTEKIEEHPEEYLSFPYKKEDYIASEHHNVDVDLDAMEDVKVPEILIKKPEVKPTTTVELNTMPEVEVLPSPKVLMEEKAKIAAAEPATVPKPVAAPAPVSATEAAPAIKSILEQNLENSSISSSREKITELSDDLSPMSEQQDSYSTKDPYREPVE